MGSAYLQLSNLVSKKKQSSRGGGGSCSKRKVYSVKGILLSCYGGQKKGRREGKERGKGFSSRKGGGWGGGGGGVFGGLGCNREGGGGGGGLISDKGEVARTKEENLCSLLGHKRGKKTNISLKGGKKVAGQKGGKGIRFFSGEKKGNAGVNYEVKKGDNKRGEPLGKKGREGLGITLFCLD